MSIVILPISAVAGHDVGEVRAPARRRHRARASPAVGFGLFATLGTGSGFWPFLFVDHRDRRRRGAGDDAGHQRDRRVAAPAKQGVASAVNDTSRELGAAFGVAVLGSAFNIGYRNAIDGHLGGFPAEVAHQAREAPGHRGRSVAARVPGGDALAAAAREAFTTGMRYAVLVGAGLLVVGALFVWFRGASAVEEVLEDDLDTLEVAAA